MICGVARSSSVIERMIASTGFSSSSSISAPFSSLGMPGIIPRSPPSGPIFLSCCICSRKSSSVNSPSSSLRRGLLGLVLLVACSAFSMSVSMSPMPRMRPAMRSGWNCSKSSSFSPVEAKAIGLADDLLDRQRGAAAGVAVELGEDHAVERQGLRGTPRRRLTASWPVIASIDEERVVGRRRRRRSGGPAPSSRRRWRGGRRCRR